ncbi:hypothetical protein F5Y15DRAFT_396268 [Xylariaceae sp. FL0016]|nr:hypothetical protein F5Y15DRAFT_396268 [Xylariaceae sp. FL0016]
MDAASVLDPRLRDSQGPGEDSIVVNHPAAPDSEQEDSQSPSDQLQQTGISPGGSASAFTPQTPTQNPLGPSTDGGNPYGSTPQDPNDPKRPRACEACRGLKVKCEPLPDNPDGPCKRCTKAGRNCLVTQPTRKRQKKTDSRVAELEKKIDALTASLQATRGGASHPGPPEEQHNGINHASYGSAARDWGAPPPRETQSHFVPEPEKSSPFQPPLVMAGQKRKMTETRESSSEDTKERSVSQPTSLGRQQHSDMIDRGILTPEDANVLFQRYTERMAIHLPAVVFPRGTTFMEVRKSKPILFLSIMAVASSESPTIQRQLIKELMQIFAEKIIIIGEKSLEMVQAILVSVIWYFPPEHFEELKFYQMVHLAAVMSIDIGLGRKKNNPKSRLIPYTWRDHPFRKQPLPDPTTVEARRTWLASYFLASNVAMALHRPNLIRWQAFMTECMDILESSPEAAPTDRYLCHLVWTHRLAEEVGIQFSMDDPSVFVNITEQKVQYALRGFERDLAKYSDGIPKEDKQPSLILSFHVLSLYMHEIALYVDKNSDEYRAPINADALRDPIPGLGDSLTAAHIGALSACLTAIDGIFETFLSMDVPSIRCLPIFNFVRVAYAVVVLIKMYFSASSPNSELGKVINKDHMKVAEYLEKLLEKFKETAANDKSRPAGKFLVVLVMLRGWFHKQGQSRAQAEEQQEPSLPSNQGPQRSNSSSAQINQGNGAPQAQNNQQQPQQQRPQQLQQHPQASDFNPANTPLQLLSEIATGNSLQRNGTNTNPNTNVNSPASYQPWLQPGSAPTNAQPYQFDPNTGNMLPTTTAGTDTTMPWMGLNLNAGFGNDFDYSSMGDGFEQAMGLTLTGFGGGSPGDTASYDTTMRMMMQDNMLNGMFENFPSGGTPFGF